MLKYIALTILCSSLIGNTKAQQPTRLVGYEETCSDSFGNTLNYKAYWNKFSGKRGSVITPFNQVGFILHNIIEDISAPDTTWAVAKHFGTTPYTDSSMMVWVYDNNDNPIESKKFIWNFSGSSWGTHAAWKDSFFYSSNRLAAHTYYQYDTVTNSFKSHSLETFTYNTNGKLVKKVTVGGMTEYIWSGNDETNERYYDSIPGGNWRLTQEIFTNYTAGKATTQADTGWTYLNNIATPYDICYKSNTHNGNTLTGRSTHLAGYPTSNYTFNFRETYQYDSNGNVDEIIFEAIDSFGVWKNDRKLELTYNSDNNPLLIKYYDTIGGGWKLSWQGNTTTQRYYYDTIPASVATHTKTEFSLYPSPAENSIYLKTRFDETTNCHLAIVDLQGRLLRQWTERIRAGSSVTTVPVDNLPAGNYFLRLSSSGETAIQKFSLVK